MDELTIEMSKVDLNFQRQAKHIHRGLLRKYDTTIKKFNAIKNENKSLKQEMLEKDIQLNN